MDPYIYKVAVKGKEYGYCDREMAKESFLNEIMHATPGSVIEYWKDGDNGERIRHRSVKVLQNSDFEEVA